MKRVYSCFLVFQRVVVAGFVQTFDLELRNKTAFEPHELFSCKMRSKAGCSDFDCSRMYVGLFLKSHVLSNKIRLFCCQSDYETCIARILLYNEREREKES